MTRRTPVGIVAVSVLAALIQPGTSIAQHPPAAPHQAPPVGRPGTSAPAEKSGEGGTQAGDPASLQDLAKRIGVVMSEHAGSLSKGGTEAAPPSRPKSPSARPAPAPAPATRKRSLVSLTWDPALTTSGIALSWDEQLNPRRVRPADPGVRLAWPAGLNEK